MGANIHITMEHVRKMKSRYSGYFKLSDGSKTKFEIGKDCGWQQWGNTTENLYVSVSRLEQLERELHGLE